MYETLFWIIIIFRKTLWRKEMLEMLEILIKNVKNVFRNVNFSGSSMALKWSSQLMYLRNPMFWAFEVN